MAAAVARQWGGKKKCRRACLSFAPVPGAFDWITFDESNGILGLNLIGAEAVPEPASLGVLAVGAVGLLARRGRRR